MPLVRLVQGWNGEEGFNGLFLIFRNVGQRWVLFFLFTIVVGEHPLVTPVTMMISTYTMDVVIMGNFGEVSVLLTIHPMSSVVFVP